MLAGRLPNPELSVTLENVAGDGAYQGDDAAELTIELSQPIELGGKRQLRREAAELGRQLAANGQKLSKQNGAQPLDTGDPLPALQAAGQVLALPPLAAADPDAWLKAAVPAWAAREMA